MFGKASVLLVLGFSIIFNVIGYNYVGLTARSVENFSNYFTETNAHNIAVSGANMAANQIFLSKVWGSGYTDLAFSGGIINVTVDSNKLIKTVTSTGTYNGVSKVVKIILQPSFFSKYGNFYSTISAQPATGDTFNGPFHVNGTMYTYGTPVFWGKVTSKGTLSKSGSPKDPKFYGGYESGIDIPLEFDTTGMRNSAATGGKMFRDTTNTGKTIFVQLIYNTDGTVTHNFTINDGKKIWSPPITEPVATFAKNGIVYVEKGNIFTKGVIDQKLTMVATRKGAGTLGSSDSLKTKIYSNTHYGGHINLIGDLQYKVDPKIDPVVDDMVGLVAEQDIRIVANNENLGRDITSQASMFSLNGNIGPSDSLVNQPYLGKWNILGGMIAKTTRVTAKYGTVGGKTVPINGLSLVHRYDERFLLEVPPFFPNTRHYEVLSWYE